MLSYEPLKRIVASFDGQNRWLTQSHLLFHELFLKNAFDQCSTILQSDLDELLNDFAYVLRPIGSSEAVGLVREFGDRCEKMRFHLLVLFSFAAVEISNDVFDWLFMEAVGGSEKNRRLAFLVLARLSPEEFGKRLWKSSWKWQRALPAYESVYGSLALIHGTASESLEDVAPRIAPGLLLYAIKFRGSKFAEISLGTSILHSILNTSPTLGDFELRFNVEMPQQQELTVKVRLDYGNELPDFSGTLVPMLSEDVNVWSWSFASN